MSLCLIRSLKIPKRPKEKLKPRLCIQNTCVEPLVCPVCDAVIVEDTDNETDDDAVFCEGICQAWIHRKCVSMSKVVYEKVGKSDDPYICPNCIIIKQSQEITELKIIVKDLTNKIDQLSMPPSSQPMTDATSHQPAAAQVVQTESFATPVTNKQVTDKPIVPPKPPPITDRKYNVVLYGINESPADTPRSDQFKHDQDNMLTVLSDIDPSLTSASVKDFFRLGKYKRAATHPRPILVKFLRAFEASLVLSNKGSLSSSTISIKPDMTRVEWETEQALLKERRNLIDNGMERRFIRIVGNSLYVNGKLHGSVQNSQFCPVASSDNIVPMSVDSDPATLTDSVPSSNPPEQLQAAGIEGSPKASMEATPTSN